MTDKIEVFLNALDDNDIDYVHWKSNTNIDKALSGEDDLDILVDPNKKQEVYKLFKDQNIIRGYSEKDSWQHEIFHYFGMDIYNKKLVHIHLHFLLEVGYDFDKSISLPIVEKYIEDRIKYKSIYIPEVEKEYILLIVRLLLKNALTPFLLMMPTAQYRQYKNLKINGVVTGNAYNEFIDLRSRTDRDKLKNILKDIFPFISHESFIDYEKVVEKNDSIIDYFIQAKKLKNELKKYSYHTGIKSFFLSFYRINQGRITALLKNRRYFKKIPQNGGRIFAFVGGDGAGKSTNIEILRKILNKHFYTEVIHIGRPKKDIIGTFFRIISKLLRLFRLTNLASAIGYVAIANDRQKSFETALKIRNQGGIVLLDRIPLEGITAMDCPRVYTIENGRYKWLSKIEKKMYTMINGVDELIALKLNPKIALQRRPEDDADELLIRSGQIWDKDFSKIENAHTIVTSNSFDYIEESILKIVWQSINKKPMIYEILGVAGSGKSTMIKLLDSRYENLQFDIDDINKQKGLFLISKIPVAIYILYKTKDITFSKAYLYFQVLLEAFSNCKIVYHKKLLFDQGPIFLIAMLMRVIPSLESYLLKELAKILVHFDEIIYLEAPVHVLTSRINTREQEHDIKNSDKKIQKQFIEEYSGIYEKILEICYEKGIKVTKINTELNDMETVEKMIVKILNKDKNT